MSAVAAKRCPHCKQRLPVPAKPVRLCWRCKVPMGRHDKWILHKDGRARHRDCRRPESYEPHGDAR